MLPRDERQHKMEGMLDINKIAIQAILEMEEDKDASGLSRVHMYISLSVNRPYEILVYSILFLNILLECTQSADSLFHSLMVLWEN